MEKWITRYWKTDRRYYQAEIMQDLFGVWIIKRTWGGLNSRRGGNDTKHANSYDEALQMLHSTAKRRIARGYNPA